MKKTTRIGALIIAFIAVIVLTFQITYDYVGDRYQKKIEELTKNQSDFTKLSLVSDIVRENFYGDISESAIANASSEGFVEGLGDKYSRYLSAEKYTEYKLEKSTTGAGIGIRAAYSTDGLSARIYSVFPDSPARSAGVLKGDMIVSVDGQKVSDIGGEEVIKLIHGKPESTLNIVVSRLVGGSMRDIELNITRKDIDIWTLDYETLENNIGLIQIYSFSDKTFDQFQFALDELKKQDITSLIIDLRNNSGGVLESAVKILDRIVPEGNMYITSDNTGKLENHMSDKESLNMPIAVLTNGETASAAELIVAGLHDFKKAVVIGEKTYGKGVIQSVFELEDGSALILTTKGFFPPVSQSFNQVGITPDIYEILYMTNNIYFTTHESDNQLKKAIDYLSNPQSKGE